MADEPFRDNLKGLDMFHSAVGQTQVFLILFLKVFFYFLLTPPLVGQTLNNFRHYLNLDTFIIIKCSLKIRSS